MTKNKETIGVHLGKTSASRQLSVSHIDWFSDCEYFTIKDDGAESLTFIKCYSLDPPSHTYKLSKIKSFTIVSDIPIGRYAVDQEESDEDKLVVNYKQ